MCYTSIEFHIEIQKISRRLSRSPKYAELSHFTLLFSTGGLSAMEV